MLKELVFQSLVSRVGAGIIKQLLVFLTDTQAMIEQRELTTPLTPSQTAETKAS